MPYKSFIDREITTLEVDAIINSVSNNNNQERLFLEVLNAAKSDILENDLRNREFSCNEIFITGGYKIPCKNILHIVTPYKEDDINNAKLKKAYEDAICIAISLGHKSLALTTIGVDNHGYTKVESYNALMAVVSSLLNREEKEQRDIIDIVFIDYIKRDFAEIGYKQYEDSKKDLNLTTLASHPIDFSYRKLDSFSLVQAPRKSSVDGLEGYRRIQEFYEGVDIDNFLIPRRYRHNSFENYIKDYVEQTGIKEKKLLSFDRTSMAPYRKAQLKLEPTLRKSYVFIFAWALGFDKDIAVQFMIINNVSFNPYEKLDMFFMDYLDGKYGKIDEACKMRDLVFANTGVDFQIY